jgi:hypothetical protein
MAVETNTEETLRTKPVGELRRILDGRKVDYSDCLEKSELIQRVLSTEVAVAVNAPEEPKGAHDHYAVPNNWQDPRSPCAIVCFSYTTLW